MKRTSLISDKRRSNGCHTNSRIQGQGESPTNNQSNFLAAQTNYTIPLKGHTWYSKRDFFLEYNHCTASHRHRHCSSPPRLASHRRPQHRQSRHASHRLHTLRFTKNHFLNTTVDRTTLLLTEKPYNKTGFLSVTE